MTMIHGEELHVFPKPGEVWDSEAGKRWCALPFVKMAWVPVRRQPCRSGGRKGRGVGGGVGRRGEWASVGQRGTGGREAGARGAGVT